MRTRRPRRARRARRVRWDLSPKALAVVCAALLVGCGACAWAFRASLTDYTADAAALDALELRVWRQEARQFQTLTDEEFIQALEEAQAQDPGADHGFVDSVMLCGVPENPAEWAPVVVTARFTGERTYVYQAFQCTFEITSVVKGEGLAAGDDIVVYEEAQIADETGNLNGGAMFSSERSFMGSSTAPFRKGQEYLLFLQQKEVPEELGDAGEAGYCFPTTKQSLMCIPIDVCDHPELVLVVEEPEGREETYADGSMVTWYEDVRLTFAEASTYNCFAADEAAKEAYLTACEKILSNTLGSR